MKKCQALVCLGALIANVFCENPIVQINDGSIMGMSAQTVEGNNTYYAFKGIPYAKPPTGSLRFKSPQKPDAWNGTLNATADGDSCIQLSSDEVIGSEDCLFINVYTTDLNMNGSSAVMVWIYGGGFAMGTSSSQIYRPDYLLNDGVIYVSFNYRLGPLGWLSTEDQNCPGNFGLKDQILALNWVQENIAHFGGDPNNVTIFGQSAGSASVSYLLQSNLTDGLFKGAIMQSGTSLNLWSLQTNAVTHAFKLGLALGILTTSTNTLIEQLREKDAEDIVTAGDIVTNLVYASSFLSGLPWAPVAEPWSNESAFSGNSHDLLVGGNFRQVPLIVGDTSNELGSAVDLLVPLLAHYDLDYAGLSPYDLTSNTVKKLEAGTKIKIKYFGLLPLSAQPAKVVMFGNIDQFSRPIREFVNLTSAYTDVYFYRFGYVGELAGSLSNKNYWGVGHADDLYYFFVSNNNSTSEDTIARKRMVRMWTNFAKYGAPSYSNDSTLFSSDDTSEWIKARADSTGNLTSTTSLYYLNITSSLQIASNPNQTDYEFYRDDIFGKYGDGSYTTW